MSDGSIKTASVSQLIRAVEESQNYSFLIGAGTSRPTPAEIPTGGELIDEWREEIHDYESPEKPLEDWIGFKETEDKADDQSRYGFWFEERHPTRGERRQRITDLVEDAKPTFGHVILATLMSDGYVPHTFTPNFDDLLYDAFYLYLEDKPQLIDHQAVAPEFRITRERPSIVKLHGDYLYDNLKNTDTETASDGLSTEIRDVLKQTISEYGLVVVGYSGTDDSIMDPLIESDLSEYGIYWCVRDTEQELAPKVKQLLEKRNTYLVEIDGFESLMTKFGYRINELSPPSPDELIERAEERASMLEGTLEERQQSTTNEEEEVYVDDMRKLWTAKESIQEGNYEAGIGILNEVIEQNSNPHTAEALHYRGIAKRRIDEFDEAIEDFTKVIELTEGKTAPYEKRGRTKEEMEDYKEAIEDYNRAIEINPDKPSLYLNRGNAQQMLGELNKALEDYNMALDLGEEEPHRLLNRLEVLFRLGRWKEALEVAERVQSVSTSIGHNALGLLFEIMTKIMMEMNAANDIERYNMICEQDFEVEWRFDELDSWLQEAEIEDKKEQKIHDLIDHLRPHCHS